MAIVVSVFLIALIFSIFGMGGGLFYMPFFLLITDNFKESTLLSFMCIFATTSSSAFAYSRKQLTDWRLVSQLGAPMVLTMFASGFFLNMANQDLLKILLGAALLFGGTLMVVRINDNSHLKGVSKRLKGLFPDKRYKMNPLAAFPLSLAIGAYAGMIGISGGVFLMPLMAVVLGAPAHTAAASTSAILAISSLLALLGRFASGNATAVLDARIFLLFAAALAGAQIGPRISIKMKKAPFKRLCGIFILLAGLIYILRTIW